MTEKVSHLPKLKGKNSFSKRLLNVFAAASASAKISARQSKLTC